MRIDPTAGEQQLHTALQQATTTSEHLLASSITSDLINLYWSSGRLAEALTLADRKAEHTRQAGLGPWTQLLDQAQRLQILRLQGQNEHVLAEVHRLVDRMAHLPDPPGDNETVTVWNVRELILNQGAIAAAALGRWQEALDLNATNLASMRARGASPYALGFARFNDYFPLLSLDRLDQAEQLLLDCQQTFEDHHDIPSLAKTLGARAQLAAQRDHHREAIRLEHTAIRLNYTRPDPDAIGASHHNLATYLADAFTDPAGQVAHHLAAATIATLTGQNDRIESWIRAVAQDMWQMPDTTPPTTITEPAAIVERVEGVKFTELVLALAGDIETAQQALDAVLRAASEPRPAG